MSVHKLTSPGVHDDGPRATFDRLLNRLVVRELCDLGLSPRWRKGVFARTRDLVLSCEPDRVRGDFIDHLGKIIPDRPWLRHDPDFDVLIEIVHSAIELVVEAANQWAYAPIAGPKTGPNRRHAVGSEGLSVATSREPDPAEAAAETDEREREARLTSGLRGAIELLPSGQREVIELVLNGFKMTEVAEALRISRSTANVRYIAARERLGRILRDS